MSQSNQTFSNVFARPTSQGMLLIKGFRVDAADGSTLESKSPGHDQFVAIYATAAVVDPGFYPSPAAVNPTSIIAAQVLRVGPYLRSEVVQ